MRLNFNRVLSHPVVLMITAVFIWMLYPPIVNYLIDQTSTFYVAAVAHSFAAICILMVTFFIFTRKGQIPLRTLFSSANLKKVATPSLLSGSLICANHLLLYAALSTSEEFDVLAILVFETWPILFFLIDSYLRRDKRKVSINDYIFTGAAFAGFIVLTAPNLDMADWLLLDSPMLQTIGLAMLGGLAMAVNCFFRMKCMDKWAEISTQQQLNISAFKRGLLTETGVRMIAAPLLVVVLLLSGQEIPPAEPITLLLIAFVGVVILALGSLLYDLSVFNAENASISSLWYLMPVGAIIILTIMEGRLLNQYEAVASILIVTSNIFLVMRYPLRSSLLILFVSVCSIGVWILFAPVSTITHYYDLLAVSTIFFVLLATFALERTTSLNHERESLLGEFNEDVVGILERLSDSDKKNQSRAYSAKIKHYILCNLHSFLRAFKDLKQLAAMQKQVEVLKYSILPFLKEDHETREHLLKLFRMGDKLQTMESDRIPAEEFVILILLGAANIFFSLAFRPETLSASLFALIVGTSMIYLLLIIFERDKYTKIRQDHALLCTNLLEYMNKKIDPSESHDDVTEIENEINLAIKERSTIRETRARSYWIFSIFAFLIGGFGYAFLYTSLQPERSVETSPLTSSYTEQEREVNIALLDWPSAQIKGYILAGIINQHTELKGITIPISNEQAFEEMDNETGLIDIHPDLWVENNKAMVRRYVTAFGTVKLGDQVVFGTQGLCYTEFDHDKKNALPITALLSPTLAKSYDLSGDKKGDIWIGANGWTSAGIEARRLAGYGLDDYYDYHVFDSEVFHMLLNRNNEKQRSTLFFCYYPDALFVNEDVRFMKTGEHDAEHWQDIIDLNNKQLPRSGTAWPKTQIKIAYRSNILSQHHELKALLNHFVIANEQLVDMLAMIKTGVPAEQVADQWIEQNNDVILEWLTGFSFARE